MARFVGNSPGSSAPSTSKPEIPDHPSPAILPSIADMTRALENDHPATDADALRLLRQKFPATPFARRMAALAALHLTN